MFQFMTHTRKKFPFWILLFLSSYAILFSCKKEDNTIRESIYKDGPKPLVKFMNVSPQPEDGKIGTEVTFAVKGLGDKKNNFSFYINQVQADVISVSDSTVTVKVPENASSGAGSVLIDGQTYYGPIFQVDGKVSIDPTWKAVNGANGSISDILLKPDGKYLIAGTFTNYENMAASEPVNRLALINNDGTFADELEMGGGSNGSINTIARVPSTGQLVIGGSFGTYDIRQGINNITLLNSDGSLDTMGVDLINPDPDNHPENDMDTVPTFNGGVTGGFFPGVIKAFYDEPSNEIIAIGNYNQYLNRYYPRSTKGGYVVDRTSMMQLTKMQMDGTMDSTFNYNPATKQSYANGNGYIADAYRMPDGKIIVVGTFTTFDGKTVNRIARINDTDGSLDQSFNTGSGADDFIGKITYNDNTGKILLTGSFKNFNGVPSNGVVMLNPDGTVDKSFKFGKTTDGGANYAGQLDNGLILVSGYFTQYNNIVRPGFMILNPDGSLADGYNNTGAFVGQINQIVESTTAFNTPAVILIGTFNRFDNQSVGNIVKIQLLP